MTSHHTYHYTVFWSENDGEYVGLCAEFPLLSWLEPDQFSAFAGIVFLVADILDDMQSTGETPPLPVANLATDGATELRYIPVKTPPVPWPALEIGGVMPFGVDAVYYQERQETEASPISAN